MKKKVLLIGCDGLRADAILATETPNLDTLMENGVYSFYATTERDTVSGACWTALLKGVHRTKHKVKGNNFKNIDTKYKQQNFEPPGTVNENFCGNGSVIILDKCGIANSNSKNNH